MLPHVRCTVSSTCVVGFFLLRFCDDALGVGDGGGGTGIGIGMEEDELDEDGA